MGAEEQKEYYASSCFDESVAVKRNGAFANLTFGGEGKVYVLNYARFIMSVSAHPTFPMGPARKLFPFNPGRTYMYKVKVIG